MYTVKIKWNKAFLSSFKSFLENAIFFVLLEILELSPHKTPNLNIFYKSKLF